MYLELNLSEEGGYLAERALDAFRQLGMGYEMAKAITNLAIASSHHGDVATAMDLFRTAREIFVRESNRVWTAMIDLYQALVTYQEERLAEASHLCERAFEFFGTSPLVGKAALCQLLLARSVCGSSGSGRRRPCARRAVETGTGRNARADVPGMVCDGPD
jgi:hypothetical protein